MFDIKQFIGVHPIVPVVGLLIFDSIAMSNITSFALNLSTGHLLIAFVCEILAWASLVLMIRHNGLAVSNGIWDVGSLVLVTLIAIFQFKEKLVMRHYFGIVLGVMSMLLLLKKE